MLANEFAPFSPSANFARFCSAVTCAGSLFKVPTVGLVPVNLY
jgi:hypothetical protein